MLEKLIEIKLKQIAPRACASIMNAISRLEKYESLGIDVRMLKERLLTLARQLNCIEEEKIEEER